MAAVLVILGVIGVIVFQSMLGGYIFSWIWEWYAVPFGLPSIHVAWAIGILLLIRTPASRTVKGEQREFGEMMVESTIHMLIIWFIAWVASFWM
jgi:hypothetical protein